MQAIRFDYVTEARGGVTMTADHDAAKLMFRLINPQGFEIINTSYPSGQIHASVLDEMAKLLVGQPNRFI